MPERNVRLTRFQRACLGILVLGAACAERVVAGEPTPEASVATSSVTTPTPHPAISPRRYRARVFELGLPAELGDVQRRFATSIAVNQKWLAEYLASLNRGPGDPLPYHANMGISAQEYRALQVAFDHPTVIEGESFDLDVLLASDGRLEFVSDGKFSFLSGLVLAPDGHARWRDVDLGVAQLDRDLEAKFGIWSGYSWERDASELPDFIDFTSVEIGLTQRSRRFMRISVRQSQPPVHRELLAWLD